MVEKSSIERLLEDHDRLLQAKAKGGTTRTKLVNGSSVHICKTHQCVSSATHSNIAMSRERHNMRWRQYCTAHVRTRACCSRWYPANVDDLGLILLMSQNAGTMLVPVSRNACLTRLDATFTTYRSNSACNGPKCTLPAPYRKSMDKTTRT